MFLVPLKIALSSLRRNVVRTLLTVIGIVIGIASVITVMSAGEGLKGYVVNQMTAFGTDYIQVEIKIPSTKKNSTQNAGAIGEGITVTTLTIDDAAALKKIPGIKNNYAGVIGQQIVSFAEFNKQVNLFGVSASFIDIDPSKLAEGRFFTVDEDRGLAPVIVLGSKVREKLFADGVALDQWVRVGRAKYKVIGVLEEKGSGGFFDMDEFIFVPIETLQKKIMGIDHVLMIFNTVENPDQIEQVAADIGVTLRDRHEITDPDKEDFAVTTTKEALETLDTVFGAITLLLIALASISLVVGGVGIMNIMYVSVAERTYEIGLRKAVGAPARYILWQFLWEAVGVTLLGAIIGIIFGLGLSKLISIIAISQGFDLPFIFVPSALVIACGVAIGIGLFFGVFPARQASKMDPVTALGSGG